MDERAPMVSTSPYFLLGAGLAALLSSGCSDEEVFQEITLSAAFVPSSVDFGERRVGTISALSVGFENTGGAEIGIESVEHPSYLGFRGLARELVGTVLAPGTVLRFDLEFRPTEETTYQGVVGFTAGGQVYELSVTGKGLRSMPPRLTLDPIQLDFGRVPLGTVERATVSIRNEAQAAVITDMVLASSLQPARDGPLFRTVEAPEPLLVEALRSTSFQVEFEPPAEGNFADQILLNVVDRIEPIVLEVHGEGTGSLGDDLTCSSIDFGAVPRGERATRRLSCSAVGGPVRVTQLSLDNPEMFSLPQGSATPTNVQPGQSFQVDVEFEARGDLGPVMSGAHIFFDGFNGPASRAVPIRARVEEPSIASSAISVQLTWTNLTDMDLYLTLPNPAFRFDPNHPSEELECSFMDLGRVGSIDDWGVRGDPGDDCYLDVDDEDGIGPERINMVRAAPGEYGVYVHQWKGSRGRPTVQIAIGGRLQAPFQSDPLDCNDLWHVGNIQWDGQDGTFTPINTRQRVSGGGCR